MNLDEIRAAWPEFGFAVYAIEPGRVVTLEVYAPNGEIYTFKGATEAEVLRRLYDPPADAVPDDVFG